MALCALMMTGCLTPPKPTLFSRSLYHMRTLKHRLSSDCRNCNNDEECEQCTKCKPCPPDVISDKFNNYNSLMDGINVHHTAECCAYETLTAYRKTTNECLSKEFEDGFVQAYLDIADGYSGETPAVPSAKYWHAMYRTPEGHALVQQWFEGYRYGAINAAQDGIGRHTVATSVRTPDDYGPFEHIGYQQNQYQPIGSQQESCQQGHCQPTQWNNNGQY